MDEKIILSPLEDIFGDRFGRYSKYIIQERALPDVRDGLKPVQRRILVAMNAERNTADKPHRKSAKTVGVVIGNYHPHGDTSVYDAMVRMSQWWKQNEVLIDMHGNNGSLDNDPAAAMRYTEARLSQIAGELLKDLDKETVATAPNFDDTIMEPTVLPARFPNLLVNGAKGIAAGYATEIPPHNLGEVIDAIIYRLKNKNCSLDEILEFIKGPDFPTGGIIQGKEGIKSAYETGKGKCVVRSKTEIVSSKNMNQIIVSEIPFEVVKSDLVKSIDQIVFDKKIDGIIEVRDESDKEGLRIAIDLKKDVDPNIILNYLFKQTELQINYNFNMVVISNKRPIQMPLLGILDAYIAHQIDVDTKRTEFELTKAKARLHILEGLVIAINNLDEVINIIRSSKDKGNCKENLISRFNISEKQAEAIVTMQLYRLSSTDITLLKDETKELEELCVELNSLLEDDKKMKKLVISELNEVRKKYAKDRISKVEDEVDDIVIDRMAMVSKEEVMVSVSRKGYAKRSSIKSYSASEEGALPALKSNDSLVAVGKCMTTDTLLVFTSKGNYLYIPVFELSENRWKDEGVHLNSIVTINGDESIVKVICVREFNPDVNIVITTKLGIIKKTSLSEFVVQRYTKPVKCMRLMNDDCVVGVGYSDGQSEIVVVSEHGNALRYSESGISSVGIKSGGVKAVSGVEKTGELVGMVVLNNESTKLTYLVTDKGGSKVINPRNINLTLRTNKATPVFKCFKSDPHLAVSFGFVNDDKKAYALLNSGDIIDVDVSERGQPFDKNMKNNLELKGKERVIFTTNLTMDFIDNNTKTYKNTTNFVHEREDNKDILKEEKKEKNYEKISILDLLGDDF